MRCARLGRVGDPRPGRCAVGAGWYGSPAVGSSARRRFRAPSGPWLAGVLGLAFWCAGVGSLPAQPEFSATLVKRFLSIGTASINGSYYPLGVAMAGLFNQHLPDTVVLAEPTEGSVANIGYLRRGDVALALVQSDVALDAFNGAGTFDGRPYPELRVLAALYSEVVHVIVRADDPASSLAGLKGRVIAVGEAGSGTELNARMILAALGFTDRDFTASHLPFTKATEALERGHVDAVFFTGGVPADGVARLAARVPVRLLPIDGVDAERVVAARACWVRETVADGSYPGMNAPVNTLGLRALLVAGEDLADDLVEQMLSLMFDRLSELIRVTPVAARINLNKALLGVDPNMLHPAARQLFVRRGLLGG